MPLGKTLSWWEGNDCTSFLQCTFTAIISCAKLYDDCLVFLVLNSPDLVRNFGEHVVHRVAVSGSAPMRCATSLIAKLRT